jgi:hypothetical protein
MSLKSGFTDRISHEGPDGDGHRPHHRHPLARRHVAQIVVRLGIVQVSFADPPE